MKPLTTFLLFISFLTGLLAQDFNKAKLDSLLNGLEKNERAMGSLSIFKDGKEVYQRAIGYADAEKNQKARAQTKYRIGSISKTFTAVMIMQMVEEEKLSLDTRLAAFFPDLPNADEISIEQMLRHRSGLFNYTNADDYLTWMEKPKSKAELLGLVNKNGTVFGPGEKAKYSNTNYLLLSFIAEKTDQKEFAAILQDRIVKPLKLKSTYLGGKISSAQSEALSYSKEISWELATETDMSIPLGAGAIVSTPTDLNIFYTGLFEGKLVSGSSLNQMTELVDNFGLGLFQIPFYDKIAFGHNGGIDGFQSTAAYFEKDKVAVAYTSNGVVTPMNDILIGVLSIYYGKEYTLPDFKPAIQLQSEELDQYLGVYGSPTFPLKVTINKKDNVLIGQATGQSSFPLEAYGDHIFRFEQARLELEFKPAENTMILKQGGEFVLKRE